VREITAGRVADYIPELALASPSWFGVSFCSVDGQVCSLNPMAHDHPDLLCTSPVCRALLLQLQALFVGNCRAVIEKINEMKKNSITTSFL
jgi:hypothetical protein